VSDVRGRVREGKTDLGVSESDEQSVGDELDVLAHEVDVHL
jgi:hypothetical protein